MEIEQLKELVANYNPLEQTSNNDFVSLLAVEQVLKNKYIELLQKQTEYEKHLSKLLNKKCKIKYYRYEGIWHTFKIEVYDTFLSKKPSEVKLWLDVEKGNGTAYYYHAGKTPGRPNLPICKKLTSDKESFEFVKFFRNWQNIFQSKSKISTNIGLNVDIIQNPNELALILSDRQVSQTKKRFFTTYDFKMSAEHFKNLIMNFYYFKNLVNNIRTVVYKNEECKQFLNESQIANLYTTIKVDISSFPKELQEEMRKFENYYQLLGDSQEEEKERLKRLQMERAIESYKQFKEAALALNNLKMEVSVEKIKLDDIETMFFKNNGQPNENGYIEIAEIFRDNMILRMIDLSSVDLTNVDIRNMDFSGTNIHINPQTIYNKDMTNVNATGLKFSPFTDKFDDVILDGTIIDDWEAMIDLDKVKSYNNQTYLPKKNKTR